MVGESLDVLPPSPQKPRQQEQPQQQQPPPLSIPFSPEFSDLPPPPTSINNAVPGNLFEQLSGPNSSTMSPLFVPPASMTVRNGGSGFNHHQGNSHMTSGGPFPAPYPQQQPMGQGNQLLLADPSGGLLPNPQTSSLLPPSFFARQPFQDQPTTRDFNSHLFSTPSSTTTMTSSHTSSALSKKSHSSSKHHDKQTLSSSTNSETYKPRSKYNNDSWLILMRGLPGSGKSYRAK